MTRNEVIAEIRAALKRRSGKAWSVTGGRGTAYGWLTVTAPPARCTWSHRLKLGESGSKLPDVPGNYEEFDTARPGAGHISPAERAELSALLGLERVYADGWQVPSSNDHYAEALDRANGRPPAKIAEQYWD